jgi:hypothetical protein
LHSPFAPPAETVKAEYSVGGFGNTFGNALALESTAGLYLQTVLFERSVGDPLINRDIWANDTAAIPPQTRVLLEENGLKVAVIGGSLPPAFQKMLETGEGAVSPQSLTFGQRTEAVVPTVGPIPNCAFRVRTGLAGEKESKELAQANAGFQFQPVRQADGRVKIRCEPQIQHGEHQEYIRPAADGSGFMRGSEMPHERFDSLGFEVVLSTGDYLVIGWPAADEGENATLGSAMFCVDGKGGTHQRVLVLRAGWRGEKPRDLPPIPRGMARPVAAQISP